MEQTVFSKNDPEVLYRRAHYHIIGHPCFSTVPEGTAWAYFLLYALSLQCESHGFLLDGCRPLTLEQIASAVHTRPEILSPHMDRLAQLGLIDQPAEAYIVYPLPKEPRPGPLLQLLRSLRSSIADFFEDHLPNRS